VENSRQSKNYSLAKQWRKVLASRGPEILTLSKDRHKSNVFLNMAVLVDMFFSFSIANFYCMLFLAAALHSLIFYTA